jgi:predicted dehydrogenase
MSVSHSSARGTVRIGVVGCGYWGSKHARVLAGAHGVAELSLIDSNGDATCQLGRTYSIAHVFLNLQSALPYVDAVVIATPPRTHAELALLATRAGKHVLVEKPLATSVREARALLAQADRSRVTLMVGHTFLYDPALRELRRRMRAGQLGEALYIHSARLNLGLYQPDVDVVWDLAPHDISVMNFLTDSLPKSATAWVDSLSFGGVHDLAFFRLEYDNPKVVGYAHISWLDPRKTRRVTVVGSEQMAVCDDLAEERLRIYDRGLGAVDTPPSPDRPLKYRYGNVIVPHIRADEPLALQDQHFIDSIVTRSKPQTDGQNGAAVVAVLEAIQTSIERNAPAKVHYPDALPNRLPAESGA